MLRLARLIAAAGLVAACAEPAPTLDDVGTRLGRAACARSRRCGLPELDCLDQHGFRLVESGETLGLAPLPGPGPGPAPAAVPNLHSFEALVDSARAGRVFFDAAEAAACVAFLETAACGPVALGSAEARPCERMWSPAVADFGACLVHEACLPGRECRATGAAACEAKCILLDQDRCRRHLDCGPDAVCDSGRCVGRQPPGGLDAPCGNFLSCADGLFCHLASGFSWPLAGTCRAPFAEGERCGREDESGGGLGGVGGLFLAVCAPGLRCAGDESHPYECLPARLEGEACAFDLACVSGWCDESAGTCAALPATGACAPRLNECARDVAFCDTTLTPAECRPFQPLGAACHHPLECGRQFGDPRCELAPGFAGICVTGPPDVERLRCEP